MPNSKWKLFTKLIKFLYNPCVKISEQLGGHKVLVICHLFKLVVNLKLTTNLTFVVKNIDLLLFGIKI
jgi:hypothetical protein